MRKYVEFEAFLPRRPFNFQNPREIDVHACPPLAERTGGGAGTKSNRATPYKAITRAERATSVQSLEKGSNLVV